MKLPILILNPHSRCNCRCAMCDIWKTTERGEFGVDDLLRQTAGLEALGVEWVVLSGGEALMHSDLFALCSILRQRSIRISLLSSGLLLEKYASGICTWVDDVIVSLDGPGEVHDRIRGVKGAFAQLSAGVRAMREIRADFPVTARCTVQKQNCRRLVDTVHAASAIGLDSISFLAADLASEAFNRAGGWPDSRRQAIAPGPDDLQKLAEEVERLIAAGLCTAYVAESPVKLRKMVAHFRAHLGLEDHVAPLCNAPWVSAVIEATGEVRPCFFHRPYGKIGVDGNLAEIVNGPAARIFREQLDIPTNAVCQQCVCSLTREGAAAKPAIE